MRVEVWCFLVRDYRKNLDYLTLKMMPLQSFEMSGTTRRVTQRDFSEDVNLQQRGCVHLRFRMTET